MKTQYLLSLILIGLLLTSCSNIREVHYFKDKITEKSDAPTKTIANYYKVEIRGYSFLSSSRYLSGYFDQSAINLYFNEFTQPEDGKLFGNNPQGGLTDETGNELVLIFSTNAKAISDQIGNISKNQVILNSAASLIQEDKIKEAQKLKMSLNELSLETNNFIFQSDSYLKGISTKTEAEKKLAIRQFLQILQSN
ncbi:hypothetical protein [uncultured Flavobacterium sp.]|uniref:hypothetical protein n=1 Tax=uncultured Flavobacterium sp. TaxID=165435 RepID=UPI0011FE32D9|nr:hypothetical protein [uncultured Flavobacterium sp.]THD32484.1 MAG: hypothetical protein DI588_07665 [Flavobacterium johnsoniae]